MAAAINELLSQIQQSFLQELTPTPARRVSEVGRNQFDQPRFGDGNIVIGYNAAGHPLTMKITGTDDDLSILQQSFVDHVRTIEVGDVVVAQKLAEVFEAMFGATLVLDEPQRRRIRRAAGPRVANGTIPEGYIRDQRTGEIRPRMRAGRKKSE